MARKGGRHLPERVSLFLWLLLMCSISTGWAGEEPHSGPGADKENTKILESFVLEGLDGEKHSLAEWKGKVIVLNFWASWCGPCQAEIPLLVRFQKQFSDRGLQVVGVGLDDERKLRNTSRTLYVNYPVLVAEPGSERKLMRAWGSKTGMVPHTVFIDRNGKPVRIHRGPITEPALLEIIEPLLERK